MRENTALSFSFSLGLPRACLGKPSISICKPTQQEIWRVLQEAKRELAEENKRKFGTMYASLCRRSESPGYKMAQLELVRTTTALHEHPRWEEYAELTEKLRERALAIAGLKGAVEAAHDNHKKQKGLGAKVTEYEAQCRAMEMQAADAKDAMAAEWSAHECAVEALRVILRPTE